TVSAQAPSSAAIKSEALQHVGGVFCAKSGACGSLFHHNFYFAAGFEPIAGIESIEHTETVQRAIGHGHFARELLDSIAGRDRHNAKAKRFCLLGFGNAHAAEAADRITERPIALGRAMLGSKNEAVHVAAEADRIEPKVPLFAFGSGGGARKTVNGE